MLGSLPRTVDVTSFETRGLLRRWWFWAGTLFMLSAIAAGYVLIPFEGPAISQATCDKIEVGWTEEQVLQVLGHCEFAAISDKFGNAWICDVDGNALVISFDSQNHVRTKSFVPSTLPIFERIKSRMERRLHVRLP